ncbi:UNVERIFIED_CONTAM: Zinc finger CCCH domain-containing protein 48 [Sesamum calycinum]|uniref:Zinc finger CCCH domain-containing protein 48 n=1 Tax=Sesamum calycinum TaxID=2727403 RepID=A0AAW2QV14_9LAMI
MDVDGGRRMFQRLGPSSSSDNSSNNKQQKVCFHWRQGKCTRYPCPFLHSELPTGANGGKRAHQGFGAEDNYRGGGGLRRSGNYNFSNSNTWGRVQSQQPGNSNRTVVKKIEKLCNHWVQGSCKFGDSCKFLHQWSTGDCFTLLAPLEGHQQVVTGIALPSGSDKLYSGSQDETVRVWDCQSGQLAGLINLGGAVGCMLSEGPWVFVGLTNLVKLEIGDVAFAIHAASCARDGCGMLFGLVWEGSINQLRVNFGSEDARALSDLQLNPYMLGFAAFGGMEHSDIYRAQFKWTCWTSLFLVVGGDLLFAGTQEGTILAWKFNVAANCFEPAASLKGHSLAVVTLVVGGNRMYSGSMDHSIKVWSLETLQCIQTLSGHTDVVMSILCWDHFLLSASLDKTVKVWAATETGNLEVTYTHTEEHGILTLCGMHDSEAKPVLFCSCNDHCIRVYDLPSFSERGKIFSKKEVRSIQIGPGGLFFTGDGSGQVKVWKWSAEPTPIS